jgi:hypothetical protein
MDLSDLKTAVDDYFNHLKEGGHSDRDENFTNEIFEQAVKFCQGEHAFIEINQLMKEREE